MVVSRWARRAAALTLVVPLLALAPAVPVVAQQMAEPPGAMEASAEAGQTAAGEHPAHPDHVERRRVSRAVRVDIHSPFTATYARPQLADVRIAVMATVGEDLSKRWNAFYKAWLNPARNVVLPWLAVLVVLLILARLATPVVVKTSAVTHKNWRPAIWWGGLLMLCAAAAVPVGVSSARGETRGWWKTPVGAFWLGIVTFVAGLCLAWALALARSKMDDCLPWNLRWKKWPPVRRRPQAAHPPRQSGWDLQWKGPPARWPLLTVLTLATSAGAAVVFVVGGSLGWAITNLERATAALWVLGVFLAVVGVVWFAVGRGQTLKLQVEVRNNDGTADPNSAHYLVARLQDLGSNRPRGLEAPQQTDVTTLPDTALKTLPGGNVAVAVNNALQLVRSAIPWHSTVSLLDDDTAVLTLARNGRVAEDTRRISRLELLPQRSPDHKDATKTDKSDTGKDNKANDGTQAGAELLTAAAAYLLCALAERHPELRQGLCGATKWESIARLAIATAPSTTQDQATKERLLESAVDADPANLLARVALLDTKYRTTHDPEDQSKLAKELDAPWTAIEKRLPSKGDRKKVEKAAPELGYGALHLRLLYLRAVVWLNVQLREVKDGRDGQAAWEEAHGAARWLVRRLGQVEAGKDKNDKKDPRLKELAAELRPAARYLWEGVLNRPKPGWPSTQNDQDEIDEICGLVKGWETEGLNRTGHYNRACWLASKQDAKAHPSVLQEALDELKQAVTDDDLRMAARRDPSFDVFKELDCDDELRKRYKQLVGDEPVTDILALAPFVLHADKLRACGISTAADLAQASTPGLAERLGVERSIVWRWQEIARLAENPPGGGPLDMGILQLLLRLDIRSCADLKTRLKEKEKLHKQLTEQAVDLKVVPTWEETIGRWTSLQGHQDRRA